MGALSIQSIALFAILVGSATAGADVVLFLENGRRIVVDRYWEEGD